MITLSPKLQFLTSYSTMIIPVYRIFMYHQAQLEVLDNNIYNKNENKLTLILKSASTTLFIKEHYQISTRRPNFLSQINKTEVVFNSLQFSTNERELKSFLASNVSFSLHRRI